MTVLFTRADATAPDLAAVHERLVAADRALREALDASPSVLALVSVTGLGRLRDRVAQAAMTLEPAFLAREPGAPFADRTDPQRWLRWLDQGQGGDAAAARAHTRAVAAPLADARSIEP